MQNSQRKANHFTPKTQKSFKTQMSPSTVKLYQTKVSTHTQPLSSHGQNWKFLQNRRQNQLNTLFNIRKKRLACITNINRKIYKKIATQQSHYSYNKLIGSQGDLDHKDFKMNTINLHVNPESKNQKLNQIIANNIEKKRIFGHIANVNTNTFDLAKKQFILNIDGIHQRTKSLQQTIKNLPFQWMGNTIRIQKPKSSDLKENVFSTRTVQLAAKSGAQRFFKSSQIKKRYKSAHKIELPDIFTML